MVILEQGLNLIQVFVEDGTNEASEERLFCAQEEVKFQEPRFVGAMMRIYQGFPIIDALCKYIDRVGQSPEEIVQKFPMEFIESLKTSQFVLTPLSLVRVSVHMLLLHRPPNHDEVIGGFT